MVRQRRGCRRGQVGAREVDQGGGFKGGGGWRAPSRACRTGPSNSKYVRLTAKVQALELWYRRPERHTQGGRPAVLTFIGPRLLRGPANCCGALCCTGQVKGHHATSCRAEIVSAISAAVERRGCVVNCKVQWELGRGACGQAGRRRGGEGGEVGARSYCVHKHLYAEPVRGGGLQ